VGASLPRSSRIDAPVEELGRTEASEASSMLYASRILAEDPLVADGHERIGDY
jgi:hypothetical protein